MNSKILKFELLGIFFIFLIGSLLHFIFNWLNKFWLVGIFSAVNESILEHLKLAVIPAILWALLESRFLKSKPNNFLFAKALGIYLMPTLIIIFFYSYTALLGRNLLAIDILIFILAVLIAQLVSYKIMTISDFSRKFNFIFLFSIIILFLIFALFTFYPPHIFLFQDPISGEYGIIKEKAIFCAQDAKLCSDGSYVSRIPPRCDFTPCPKEDLIIIESPKANEEIFNPLIIKGKARGFWFFEGDFPIKLFDEKGNLLATTIAQAKSDWMSENFVPFEAELKFEIPKIQKGFLVFEKDNPSGLPEQDYALRMPVLFKQGREVNLYYYNPGFDQDKNGNTLCSQKGLVAVKRIIPFTQTPIQDTINLLLKGELTQEEKSQGIITEYPLEGFSLKGASLKEGFLQLEFEDLYNKTVGGACRVAILWFQIEATAKQFPEVKQVRFLPEEIFQP